MPQPETPNLLTQATKTYPILGGLNLAYKYNPQPDQGYMEFWPSGEPGAGQHLRPSDIPLQQPGIEVYNPQTRPIDIMGDVVSHYLINKDPKISSYYKRFESSLTPHQQAILQDQYQWARQHEGEARSFEDWKSRAGLPAYFRGYAFQQWPQDFNVKAYTPQQLKMFDEMMQYLQSPRPQSFLMPVDHDPFASLVKFIPVDHDPFNIG